MIKERFSVKEFLVAIATDLTLTQPPGYLNILHLIKIYQHVKVTSVKLLKLIQSIPIRDGNPAKKIGGFGFYCIFFALRIRIPIPNLITYKFEFQNGKIYLDWQQQISTNDKTSYLHKITFTFYINLHMK